MDKKKLNQNDLPALIPGIYNYCDRWCERCKLQMQCISFVMGKKIIERNRLNAKGEGEKKNLWSRLKNVFKSTCEILREVAEERGMKVEDIYASEQINKQFLGDGIGYIKREGKLYKQIEACDILKICKVYEYWGERTLDRFTEYMEKEDYEHAEDIEVVTWYLDLIQAKMRRALYSYALREKEEISESENYDGLSKVALISIDCSVISWKRIQSFYPEYAREITHLLIMLEQLQTDIERQFPDARKFLRPGFDVE